MTQEELYATGDWICIFTRDSLSNKWRISNGTQLWLRYNTYKLIHKRHKHTLEGFLNGCEVLWRNEVEWEIEDTFIEMYHKDAEYLCIPKSLAGCYCEATEFNFLQLSKEPGLTVFDTEPSVRSEIDNYPFLFVHDDKEITCGNGLDDSYNKVEFNTSINKWVYKEQQMEKKYKGAVCKGCWSLGNNCGVCEKCLDTKPEEVRDGKNSLYPTMTQEDIDEIIEAMGGNVKEPDSFNKAGFETPEWGGVIHFEDKYTCHIGEVEWDQSMHSAGQDLQTCYWDSTGICHIIYSTVVIPCPTRNLVPLKPKVQYPVFKKNHIGEVYKFTNTDSAIIMLTKITKFIGSVEFGLDLASIHSTAWTDVAYDSERELYDGQPCYMNMGNDILPCLTLFNINKHYNDKLNKLTPIPLEALKHMPFVWDMYKRSKE